MTNMKFEHIFLPLTVATCVRGSFMVITRLEEDGLAYFVKEMPLPSCPICQAKTVAWNGYRWRDEHLHWHCVVCNHHWIHPLGKHDDQRA